MLTFWEHGNFQMSPTPEQDFSYIETPLPDFKLSHLTKLGTFDAILMDPPWNRVRHAKVEDEIVTPQQLTVLRLQMQANI
jgi:hypothetical protein